MPPGAPSKQPEADPPAAPQRSLTLSRIPPIPLQLPTIPHPRTRLVNSAVRPALKQLRDAFGKDFAIKTMSCWIEMNNVVIDGVEVMSADILAHVDEVETAVLDRRDRRFRRGVAIDHLKSVRCVD